MQPEGHGHVQAAQLKNGSVTTMEAYRLSVKVIEKTL